MSIYNSSLGILKLQGIMEKIKEGGGRVHFTGVLGAGQRAIARLLLLEGVRTSGSDVGDISAAEELVSLGLEFHAFADGANVSGASLLVYTLAIGEDNAEYVYAREHKIPTVSRAEMAAYLASLYEKSIAAAGSHGKSTVTAMLDRIFSEADLSPTVLSGARLTDGLFSRRGNGKYFILEACEYKDSFLKLRPTAAIINNIELDHTDYFSGIEDLKASFAKFASRAEDFALLGIDSESVRDVRAELDVPTVTFGASSDADYRYSLKSVTASHTVFSLHHGVHSLGDFELFVPGIFNVQNATAAIATAYEYGVAPDAIHRGVSSFRGIERRLEYLGEYKCRPVFYDYAHHPTEIYHGIAALRTLGFDSVSVVFKPHTYSRTYSLLDGFARSLSFADFVIVGDIYAAREENVFGITPLHLSSLITSPSCYSPDEKVPETLDNLTRGAIILMGAADMTQILSCMKIEK